MTTTNVTTLTMLALQDMWMPGVGSLPGAIAADLKIALVCGLLGLAIVVAVVRLILRSTFSLRFPRRLEDLHHTHRTPIPRFGGLALVLAFVGVEILLEMLSPDQDWLGDKAVVVLSSLAMRRQIQYALALTRWLVLEGGRARSLDDLWQDLVFIGRKLGFSYIKLTLADGQREWVEVRLNRRHPEQSKVLEAGNCGVLELRSKACGRRTRTVRRNCLRGMNCPCNSDDRLFAILCELLVEGWMAAARRHARKQGGSLTLQPSGITAAAAGTV